jgi:hypothetical protein
MHWGPGPGTEGEARSGRAAASPYRRPGEVAPARSADAPAAPIEAGTVVVVAFALACSLLRFGLFVLGPERLGADPLLALGALVVSAYCLARLLGR